MPVMAVDETGQRMIDLMLKGDPRCAIPLESRIMKAVDEPSDIHKLGHKGTVKGSLLFDHDKNLPITDVYLVLFDGDGDTLSFVANSPVGRIVQI